jgi:hypothetical protein
VKSKVILPLIPDRLLECPEAPFAPTEEGSTAKDDNVFKADLAAALKVCQDRNATIGDILSAYKETYKEELDDK